MSNELDKDSIMYIEETQTPIINTTKEIEIKIRKKLYDKNNLNNRQELIDNLINPMQEHINKDRIEKIKDFKALMSMFDSKGSKFILSEFQFADYDDALVEANQDEFDKTKYVDKNAFYNFYSKYHKERIFNRKNNLNKITPSFSFIKSVKKEHIVPYPAPIVKRQGERNSLQLNYQRLGDRYIYALSDSMKYTNHVDEILLGNNRLSDNAASKLINSIAENLIANIKNRIHSIDLSYNMISSNTIDSLCNYSQLNGCNLKRLNLEGNSLGDKLIIRLANALTLGSSDKLKYLNLSKNNLTDESMPSLAELIVNCIYLQVLNLHENQIKNNGAALIISKCKNHNEIKVLDLGWNLIGNSIFNLISKDELIAQHRSNLPKLQMKEENDKAKNDKKDKKSKENAGNDIDALYNNAEIAELLSFPFEDNAPQINFTKKKSMERLKISQFAIELGELFSSTVTTMLHLDISHNSINFYDSEYISKNVVRNHTILGIHVDGNQMIIDELGFILPVEKKITEEDYFSKAHITYDMTVGLNHNYYSNSEIIRKIKTKNNCWICEGWKEVKLTYKPKIKRDTHEKTIERNDKAIDIESNTDRIHTDYINTGNHFTEENDTNKSYYKNSIKTLDVRFHLSLDDFKNTETNLKIDSFQCFRVCRPGLLTYYYTVNGEPVSYYGKTTLELHEALLQKFVKEKEFMDDKTEQFQYAVNKVGQLMIEQTEIIDEDFKIKLKHCVPRPEKINKLKLRPRTPWIFPDSIWAFYGYSFEGNTNELTKDAFEYDFERSKVWNEKEFKTDKERVEIKELLRKYYPGMINVYKYLSSKEGFAIFQIGQTGMNEFASYCNNLIDKNYTNNFLYLKAAETVNLDREERKKNKLLPDNLVRHQFMNFLVKVAKDKYFLKQQIYPTAVEAVINTFEIHYANSFTVGDTQIWRKERYYNEFVDNVLKSHFPLIDAIFKTFAHKDVGKRE